MHFCAAPDDSQTEVSVSLCTSLRALACCEAAHSTWASINKTSEVDNWQNMPLALVQ